MASNIGMRVNSAELEDLSRRLKAQGGPAAQRRYQRAVQQAAAPIRAELRTAALAAGTRVTSSRSGRSRHAEGSQRRQRQGPLSGRVARAVASRPSARGVRFVIEASKVDPEYGHSLPRYLDGELPRSRRWRHPVFGNEDKWTNQTGAPWFFRTIRRRAGDIEKAVLKAMDAVANDITR